MFGSVITLQINKQAVMALLFTYHEKFGILEEDAVPTVSEFFSADVIKVFQGNHQNILIKFLINR
jgi:hypothetical protein